LKHKILGITGTILFLFVGFTAFNLSVSHDVYADTETTLEDMHENDILTQSDLESDELEYDANPQAELDTVADDEPVSRADAEQARLENEDDKLIKEFDN
jgi:hypothetical protein